MPAIDCLTFFLGCENQKKFQLCQTVHIALQQKRIATTRLKNTLQVLKNLLRQSDTTKREPKTAKSTLLMA